MDNSLICLLKGMIITRLTGGLGNQMFQYAIARSFLKKDNERVFLDTFLLLTKEEEDIEKIYQRPYALDIFKNLKAKVDEKKISGILRDDSLINRIRRKLFYRSCTVVEQELMEWIDIPSSIHSSKNILFKGLFQSERFFKTIRKELLNDFTFPEMDIKNKQIMEKILATPGAVSIHIRRGDYLSSSNKNIFNSVSMDYYDRSIDILMNKTNEESLTGFVFTDDIGWAQQNYSTRGKLNLHFVEGNHGKDSWKDMALMSACSHHIIANSSFSWWGAWLAKKDGINLAPSHWYMPGSYMFNIADIIPQNWIIVDYCFSQEKKYKKDIA